MKYLVIIFLLSCNSGPKNKTFSKAELDSAMMKETHIGWINDSIVNGSRTWGDTTHHLKKKKHRRTPDLGQIEAYYPDTWEPSRRDTLIRIDTTDFIANAQFATLYASNMLTIADSGKIVASRDSAGKWTIIDGQAALGILTKLLLSADSSLQKCKP